MVKVLYHFQRSQPVDLIPLLIVLCYTKGNLLVRYICNSNGIQIQVGNLASKGSECHLEAMHILHNNFTLPKAIHSNIHQDMDISNHRQDINNQHLDINNSSLHHINNNNQHQGFNNNSQHQDINNNSQDQDINNSSQDQDINNNSQHQDINNSSQHQDINNNSHLDINNPLQDINNNQVQDINNLLPEDINNNPLVLLIKNLALDTNNQEDLRTNNPDKEVSVVLDMEPLLMEYREAVVDLVVELVVDLVEILVVDPVVEISAMLGSGF